MDIEQLRLILEAATAAGTGAMQIVVMWFGLEVLRLVVVVALWLASFTLIFKIFRTIFDKLGFTTQLEAAYGYKLDEYHPNNRAQVIKIIKEGV
jgi:hypothetical protein